MNSMQTKKLQFSSCGYCGNPANTATVSLFSGSIYSHEFSASIPHPGVQRTPLVVLPTCLSVWHDCDH